MPGIRITKLVTRRLPPPYNEREWYRCPKCGKAVPPSEEWQTRKKLDQWKRYMRLASELTQLTIAELWWLCPKCLWPVLIGARDAYKAFRALRDDEDPWWERRWY